MIASHSQSMWCLQQQGLAMWLRYITKAIAMVILGVFFLSWLPFFLPGLKMSVQLWFSSAQLIFSLETVPSTEDGYLQHAVRAWEGNDCASLSVLVRGSNKSWFLWALSSPLSRYGKRFKDKGPFRSFPKHSGVESSNGWLFFSFLKTAERRNSSEHSSVRRQVSKGHKKPFVWGKAKMMY